MLKSALMLSVAGILLGACASMPDVTYTYYLAKSSTVVMVTETLTCSDAKQVNPTVSFGAPSVTTTYAADFARPQSVSMHDLNSAFADNSFSMVFTNDGRLKTVNGSSTGQGQTILQGLITLGTTVAAFGGGGAHGAKATKTACNVVIADSADGKSITFTYSNARHPADLGGAGISDDMDIQLGTPMGSNADNVVRDLLGVKYTLPQSIVLHIGKIGRSDRALVSANDPTRRYPGTITVQKIVRVPYDVEANGAVLAYGAVVAPRTDGVNDTYDIPITGATFFGTQSFTLTPSDDGSGSVGTATYGANAGTAASNVITVINSGLTAAKP